MQNLQDLVFKQSKGNFKIFRKVNTITNNVATLEKVKLTSTPMILPFGVEKYKNKEIVNVEFTDLEKSNDVYNFFTQVRQIDNFMNRLSYDSELVKTLKFNNSINEVVKLVDKKMYTSCIRNKSKKFDPLLRVHLKKVKNKILTDCFITVNNNKMPVDIYSLKNKSCTITLELDSLWITSTGFGLVWLCDTIELASH